MTDSDPVVVKLGPLRFNVTAKGILLALAFLTTGTAGPVLLAANTGLATSDEVKALADKALTIDAARAEYAPKFDALDAKVQEHTASIAALAASTGSLQESIWEGRAEALASEAAAKVRDARSSGVARARVKELALDNLRHGRPIHAGIDGYLR